MTPALRFLGKEEAEAPDEADVLSMAANAGMLLLWPRVDSDLVDDAVRVLTIAVLQGDPSKKATTMLVDATRWE